MIFYVSDKFGQKDTQPSTRLTAVKSELLNKITRNLKPQYRRFRQKRLLRTPQSVFFAFTILLFRIRAAKKPLAAKQTMLCFVFLVISFLSRSISITVLSNLHHVYFKATLIFDRLKQFPSIRCELTWNLWWSASGSQQRRWQRANRQCTGAPCWSASRPPPPPATSGAADRNPQENVWPHSEVQQSKHYNLLFRMHHGGMPMTWEGRVGKTVHCTRWIWSEKLKKPRCQRK